MEKRVFNYKRELGSETIMGGFQSQQREQDKFFYRGKELRNETVSDAWSKKKKGSGEVPLGGGESRRKKRPKEDRDQGARRILGKGPIKGQSS